MPYRWGRRLLLIAITASLVVLALEVFSAVALRVSEGRWIGPGDLADARAATARGERGDTLRRVMEHVTPILDERMLHPYLGFVMDPRAIRAGIRQYGLDPLSVELGFPRNTQPLLQPPDPERLVVGIFGGSVADVMSHSGADALRAELARVPGLSGREIVVLSAAAPGYKQPQALMTLNYLLLLGGHFDVVVNLDGVNELALPAMELEPVGVTAHYPRGWHARTGNLTAQRSALAGQVMALENVRGEGARRLSESPLRASLTAGLLWRLLDRWLEGLERTRSLELLVRPAGHDPQAQGPRLRSGDPIPTRTALWQRSSLQMARLCEGLGIRYLHALQPNQYVPGSKPEMGEEERRVAINERSPFREPVASGYPALREAGAALAADGVAFVDLSGVFRDVSAPVYGDDCCHLNERGNELLGAAVGRALAASP